MPICCSTSSTPPTPTGREQADVVDKLVVGAGAAGDSPRLEVFNKCDKLDGDILPHGEDIVSISARTGAGVDRLLAAIENRLGEPGCAG